MLLFLLFILPGALFSALPIIIAVYFTFSKKHRDEAGFRYHAWWD